MKTTTDILNEFISKENKAPYETLLVNDLISSTKELAATEEELNKILDTSNKLQISLVQLRAKQSTIAEVILKLADPAPAAEDREIK